MLDIECCVFVDRKYIDSRTHVLPVLIFGGDEASLPVSHLPSLELRRVADCRMCRLYR